MEVDLFHMGESLTREALIDRVIGGATLPAWVCDGCGKAHLSGAWAFQFIVYRLDSHDSEMVTIANVCDLECLELWLAEQRLRDRAAAG